MLEKFVFNNDKPIRKTRLIRSEICFFICLSFGDVGLNYNVNFWQLKRKCLRFLLKKINKKPINVKLKMSRFKFKYNNNSGSLVGCYRAVW